MTPSENTAFNEVGDEVAPGKLEAIHNHARGYHKGVLALLRLLEADREEGLTRWTLHHLGEAYKAKLRELKDEVCPETLLDAFAEAA